MEVRRLMATIFTNSTPHKKFLKLYKVTK
ncbi:hypothetical protein E2C01_087452 [Portunus trituberculatus]|uniref:Uncharacterized protein n=1 Tax=Portunus trituberculatus TaxID=210409 RepID=A0A5B7JE29_PORTR|nr:hypothetical protein [Portunus trituberculatus]